MATTPRSRLVALCLGIPALLGVLLICFAWPASEIAPRDLPVVVAGDPAATSALQQQLIQANGEDAFEITTVDSRAQAVEAIEDRDAYAGLVAGSQGLEVLTAPAASPTVAQLFGQVASASAAQGGPPATVTEVVPLPRDDPRGAVFGAGALPIVLGGIVTGALLALAVTGRGARLAGAVTVAGLGGLAMASVLQGWLGALSGSYLANSGVLALGLLAIAVPILGLHRWLAQPGIGLVAATVMLIGNPLSGLSSAPELLPLGGLGQWLPPGAVGAALRGTAFFDGAGLAGPLLVLAGWIMAGLVLLGWPGRRAADDTPAERTHLAGTGH